MKFTRKLTKSEADRHFIYFERKYKKDLPNPREEFKITINGKKMNTVFDTEGRIWLGSKIYDDVFKFQYGDTLEFNIDISNDVFEISKLQ